jgi:hypothetical protein
MLESRARPSWWERKVSPRVRRTVSIATALAVGSALGGLGVVELRQELAERRQARLVRLAVSLDVWTSSPTAVSGGQVVYYLTIRNGGAQPLEITSIEGTAAGLDGSSRGGVVREVDAGEEVLMPLSALLTCPSPSTDATDVAPDLRVVLGLRRDGSALTPLRDSLDGAALLLDAAQTLCTVRPELRRYELSGPVIRPATDDPTEG